MMRNYGASSTRGLPHGPPGLAPAPRWRVQRTIAEDNMAKGHQTKSPSSPAPPTASARPSPSGWPRRASTSPRSTSATADHREGGRGGGPQGVGVRMRRVVARRGGGDGGRCRQPSARRHRRQLRRPLSADSLEDVTFAEWRRIIGTNLDGTFLVSMAFVPGMKARGWADIVNLSSSTVGSVVTASRLMSPASSASSASRGARERTRVIRHHRECDPARLT